MDTTRWKEGSRHRVKAGTAAAELRRIQEKFGGLQPGAIVDESRADKAPLHPEFEWRDEIAAEHHRRDQARAMVNDLVTVEVTSKGAVASPVYVHVRGDENKPGRYEPTRVVMNDDAMRASALAEARAQLAAFERRYAHLSELAGVLREIKRVTRAKVRA